MRACHQTSTATLLGKKAGADNACFVHFPISEECDFAKESKRREPAVGLRGCRSKRHSIVDRFWARVQKQSDGCWIFAGRPCNLAGHIHIMRPDRSRVYAHRFSYQLHHGGRSIPAGKVVMHSCDRPTCVNPAHLSLGTQKQNVHDAIAKGRFAPWLHPNTIAAKQNRRKHGPTVSAAVVSPLVKELERS